MVLYHYFFKKKTLRLSKNISNLVLIFIQKNKLNILKKH